MEILGTIKINDSIKPGTYNLSKSKAENSTNITHFDQVRTFYLPVDRIKHAEFMRSLSQIHHYQQHHFGYKHGEIDSLTVAVKLY